MFELKSFIDKNNIIQINVSQGILDNKYGL